VQAERVRADPVGVGNGAVRGGSGSGVREAEAADVGQSMAFRDGFCFATAEVLGESGRGTDPSQGTADRGGEETAPPGEGSESFWDDPEGEPVLTEPFWRAV
jgi:hypothetical protein